MANKKISQLTAVTTLTDNDAFPVVQGSETKKAKISNIKAYLPSANGTTTGLLTNTDWTTFNGKQAALSFGNLTESTSSVLTITGGTGAVVGGNATIQVKAASASQSGYLTSSDWSTFNSKQNNLTLTTTGTSGAATLVGSTLNIPQYSGGGLTSLNGQSGSSQTFATATTGTDFSIASVGNIHTFAIPSASSSNRGLLTSTDWSTFNSKEPALTKGNLTETTSSVLTISGGTGAVIGSGLTIAVSRSTASTDGYLKASDYSTFAAKQDAITLTTTGSSGAATLVGSTLNVPQYQDALTLTTTGTSGAATLSGATLNIPQYSSGSATALDINTAYGYLGSSIKGYGLTYLDNKFTNSATMTSQQVLFSAYHLPVAKIITGVRFYLNTNGNYTANNYNGVGLYSYSAGTLTLVASSTNDGTIWQPGSAGWKTKAFSSTYSASAGIYYVCAVYSQSAQVTAPSIGTSTQIATPAWNLIDFTNNAKLQCVANSQTSLAATYAMTSLVNSQQATILILY